MKSRLIPLLQRVKGWRLGFILSTLTVLAVEVVVSAMGLILKGTVTSDYLLTGLVAACIVAPLSLAVFNYFLDALAEVSRQELASFAYGAETRLNAALDAADEGILMVAEDGKVLAASRRFFELWRVPAALVEGGSDDDLLAYVMGQLVAPEQFLAEVRRLYGSMDEARDELHFLDGRVFSRNTRGLIIDGQPGRICCFKDITVQTRAQAALAEREEIYRTIVSQAGDGIGLIDVQALRFVEANDAACRMFGYAREEFLQLSLTELQFDQDEAVLRATIERLLPDGTAHLEGRRRRKDGSVITIQLSLRGVRLQDRQLVLGVWHDISERTRIEDELRDSEQKLLTVLENVDACIYLKDVDGRYLYANRQVRELWQSELVEIVGYRDDKFFDPDASERIRRDDIGVLKHGNTLSRIEETYFVHATGATTFFLTTKLPLRHADGSIYALCGISTDITARKLAEQALAEREAQLRLLVESVPDSIQFKDGSGRWLIANGICLRNFGLEEELWQGMTDIEVGLLHPRLSAAMASCSVSDELAWASQRLFQTEETGVDTQGNVVYFDVIKVPLFDEQHKRKALVVIGRDVSKRKRVEEALFAAKAELEDVTADQAVDLRQLAVELTKTEQGERERLYELLHDEVQPLLVAARLALSGLGSHTPPEQYLPVIADACEHIGRVIYLARTLSFQLSPPLIRERGLIAALESLCQWVRANHKLRTDLVCLPDAQPQTYALQLLCFNAVRELLMNAVKHSGVQVATVTTERVQGDKVRIAVADAGRGFDPSASSISGTGLAGIERRLKMFGGSMHIDSEPGQGTVVTLFTPLRE